MNDADQWRDGGALSVFLLVARQAFCFLDYIFLWRGLSFQMHLFIVSYYQLLVFLDLFCG